MRNRFPQKGSKPRMSRTCDGSSRTLGLKNGPRAGGRLRMIGAMLPRLRNLTLVTTFPQAVSPLRAARFGQCLGLTSGLAMAPVRGCSRPRRSANRLVASSAGSGGN